MREQEELSEDESTLTFSRRHYLADSHNHEARGDPRAYSSSPSCGLDGGDIFQDLSEMSNYADRIDSILDQSASEHSTRSGRQRMRSLSPWPPQRIGEEAQQQDEAAGDEEDLEEDDEEEDGEVD